MSDEWYFYPCQIGEHLASIFYDHGVRKTIDHIAPPQLLRVALTFKKPRPDGFSSNDEFQSLVALEDGLLALVAAHGGIYVGRVTVGGHRYFHVFTSDTADSWALRLAALGDEHNYRLSFDLMPDKQRDGYWQELFPSDDDLQVIKNLEVLGVLRKEGDNGTASRQIDHCAYFSSSAAAEQFSQWVQEQGYGLDRVDSTDDEKFCVCFFHIGTCELADICSHTVALLHNARELGGEYDGWEAPVCRATAS
jgi:hypothetical protein